MLFVVFFVNVNLNSWMRYFLQKSLCFFIVGSVKYEDSMTKETISWRNPWRNNSITLRADNNDGSSWFCKIPANSLQGQQCALPLSQSKQCCLWYNEYIKSFYVFRLGCSLVSVKVIITLQINRRNLERSQKIPGLIAYSHGLESSSSLDCLCNCVDHFHWGPQSQS